MTLTEKLTKALTRVDQFLALDWWWQWKLRRAEQRLAEAVAASGERSVGAASAYTALRRAQFAVEYGRAAAPEIQHAVNRAAETGLPKHVLRLMVINLDIRIDKTGQIFVRRRWWLTALAWVSRLLVIAGMALLSLQILAHSADRPIVKTVLTLIFGALFFSMAYIWDLFGVRATRAARAYGEHFKAANSTIAEHPRAPVFPLRDG